MPRMSRFIDMNKGDKMTDDDIKEIIDRTVSMTVLKLKIAGLMRDRRKNAYQKTEELLRNYPIFCKSDQPYTKDLVEKINGALKDISSDIYYDIIPMFYFEGETRERIADHFNTSTRTIGRNKARLVNKLKVKLLSDDVVFELFLK